jgi:SNF2 family DNA or RNA helicase
LVLELPAKHELTRYVYMSADERRVYDLTKRWSKNIVNRVGGTGHMKEYVNILQAIMRLRQICCHCALLEGSPVPQDDSAGVSGGTSQSDAINVEEFDLHVKKPLSAAQAYQLFDLMKEAGETTCIGCRRKDISLVQATGEKEPAKQVLGYLTPCAHPLCHTCLELFKSYIPSYREGMVASCPVCGSFAEMKMFELKERESVEARKTGRKKFLTDGSEGIEPSSKLLQLMKDLDLLEEQSKKLEKPLKSIIFSQWTTMLDLVEVHPRRNILILRLNSRSARWGIPV